MPGTATVGGFLASEWARFWDGFDKLDPAKQSAEIAAREARKGATGGGSGVNLPGWSDAIHVTPAYRPSPAEVSEFFAARAQGREPSLTPQAIGAINDRSAALDRMAASAQPPYAQAFGQIATALDNVQDFVSTVGTLGRLAVWPALSGLSSLIGKAGEAGMRSALAGYTAEAAALIGQQAGRAASIAAEAEFRAGLASLAARGNAVAAELLASATLTEGAFGAAIRGAGAGALAAAERKAALGLIGRLGARLLPGLGWILLAGDLLNLLAFLSGIGLVGYGALCHGPRAGLAAGGAQVLMRGMSGVRPCGVKGTAKGLAELNPFSSMARSSRNLRAGRAMPSIGNILEAAQTTDQVWGIGVSFGGIVGAMTEAAYGAELATRGESVGVNVPAGALSTTAVAAAMGALQFKSKALGAIAVGAAAFSTLGALGSAPLGQRTQAAQVMQSAPMIGATQETMTEAQHVNALVAYAHAVDLVGRDFPDVDWDARIADAADEYITPPMYYDPITWRLILDRPGGQDSLGRWPLPGAPRAVRVRDYVEHFAAEVPRWLRTFLEPRRDRPVAMFYGGLVNHCNALIWSLITHEDDPFKWSYTPEWAWVVSLGESNRFVDVTQEPERIWSFYTEGVARLRDQDRAELLPWEFDELAEKHGLDLIHGEQAFVRGDINFTDQDDGA